MLPVYSRILAIAFSVAISIQEARSQPNFSANPFGKLTQSESETPEQLVKRMRLINTEFADVCDARYEIALDVQNAAYQLNLTKASNPLILEFVSSQSAPSKAPGTNHCGLNKCIKLPPQLSAHMLTIYGSTFKKTASDLAIAYCAYKDELRKLTLRLRAPSADCNPAKESRANLIKLVGHEAVDKIDKGTDIEKLLVKNFEEYESDLATLAEGWLAKQYSEVDKKISETEKNENSRSTLSRRIDVILSFCNWPSEQKLRIAPNIFNESALTCPNLEPDYPTILPRASAYLLPTKPKKEDYIKLPMYPTQGSQVPMQLSAVEKLLLRQHLHSQTEQIRSAYIRYRDICRSLEATLKTQPSDNNKDALSNIVDRVKEARSSLIGLAGEDAVKQVDNQNNFTSMVTAASVSTSSDSIDLERQNYLHALSEVASINLEGPAEAVDTQKIVTLIARSHLVALESEEEVSKLDLNHRNLLVDEYRNCNPELELLCDACLANYGEANPLRVLLDTNGRPNPILLALSHGPPFDWQYPIKGTCTLPAGFANWITSHAKTNSPIWTRSNIKAKGKNTLNQVERVLVWQVSVELARQVNDSYKSYLNSLLHFRSKKTNEAEFESSANAPDSEEGIIKQNRASLVTLCGEKAVSEFEQRVISTQDLFEKSITEVSISDPDPNGTRPNTYFERFRMQNPDFAQLCDAYFDHSSDAQLLAKQCKLKGKSNSIILMFASNAFLSTGGGTSLLQILRDDVYLKNPSRHFSQTEQIMVLTTFRRMANQLSGAYQNYIASLKDLASTNMIGPYKAVEQKKTTTLERRAELVNLVGEDAVAKLDLRFKNLFADEIWKKEPELAVLCDAYLRQTLEEKQFYENYLGTQTPNPLLLILSHSPPFSWESPQLQFVCGPGPRPLNIRWCEGLQTMKSTPAYLRPPIIRGDNSSTVQLIIYSRARTATDKIVTAYQAYISAMTKFSTTVKKFRSLDNALIARLNSLEVQENRKLLVQYCGEEAVHEVDTRKNFTQLVKDCVQFE